MLFRKFSAAAGQFGRISIKVPSLGKVISIKRSELGPAGFESLSAFMQNQKIKPWVPRTGATTHSATHDGLSLGPIIAATVTKDIDLRNICRQHFEVSGEEDLIITMITDSKWLVEDHTKPSTESDDVKRRVDEISKEIPDLNPQGVS